MEKEFIAKAQKEFTKFLKNFPFKSTDYISIVLRGHLLVEELLITYIGKMLENPDAVKEFKFFHYLCLARAMEKDKKNAWVWNACEKLNNIRNKLSHHLEPNNLDILLKDFVNLVKNNKEEFPAILVRGSGEFKISIFALYTTLALKLHITKSGLGYNILGRAPFLT